MVTGGIRGIHVFTGFALGFGAIIAANLTLAFSAIATFPGLETESAYVASQRFDVERAAQEALGWTVEASVHDDVLRVTFRDAGGPVVPQIVHAALGRATHVAEDRTPEFAFDGVAFVAPAALTPGNWNLRLEALSPEGTRFRRRFVLRISR